MVRLAQVVAGFLVAMLGAASFGAARAFRPRAAGKPASQPAGQDAGVLDRQEGGDQVVGALEGRRPLVGDNVFRVYTVERVDGDRVELAADGIAGWIQAEDVVLLDRAIDFYTGVIRGNEKHLAARVKRGPGPGIPGRSGQSDRRAHGSHRDRTPECRGSCHSGRNVP